jgi:hypothetical protein
MLPVIAVPLLHSSGAWIASTAAGGYVAGTLSGSWVGAFILGNAGLLSSLAAASGIAGVTSTAAALGSSALTALGLGGVASSLGIAPTVILGLTPVGWAIAGGTTVAAGGLAVYLKTNVMKQINEERLKGGLPEIGVFELIAEIRQHEHQSKLDILTKLSKERLNFKVRPNDDELIINDEKFNISSVRYVIEESGREFLEQVNTLFPNKMIFEINKGEPS